jgi:hypothetical protein
MSKPPGILADPCLMLREIEAYLTFRLLTNTNEPSVPVEDMRMMKKDIAECLRQNGIEVDCQG